MAAVIILILPIIFSISPLFYVEEKWKIAHYTSLEPRVTSTYCLLWLTNSPEPKDIQFTML